MPEQGLPSLGDNFVAIDGDMVSWESNDLTIDEFS